MRESEKTAELLAKTLEPYIALSSQQNQIVNEKLGELTNSINELAKTQIELAKAHVRSEQIHSDNKERFSDISKSFNDIYEKINEQSRVLVRLSEQQKSNSKPREWVERIVFIAVAILASAWFAVILE